MKVTGYSISLLGSRSQNQDSSLVDNEQGLFAVADGVGGGERGDVASQMAVAGFGAQPPESSLRETVETVQEAILQEALESLGEARMGTTLTGVRIQGETAELVHVGDSRCYKYADGELLQLTVDHEAFDENYGGPVLASYLGIPTDVFPLQVQEESFGVNAGERLLLCSDGLYKQVPEEEIARLIQQHYKEPEKLLQILGDQASQAEHSDNITIVYIEIEAA